MTIATEATGTKTSTPAARWLALTEVIFAFATMHLCVKAVKQLTILGSRERELGLNFTPGVVMAIATFVCLLLKREDRRRFGIASVAILSSVSARLLILSLYLVPLVIFLARYRGSYVTIALVFLGHIAITSVGEELFFRGYVQSRVDHVFGRPWRVRGVAVGWGLIFSALLFGLLHALNTVDYFRARFDFAWGWAGGTMVMGLVFGFIREKTGSVIPCIVVHGSWNVWFISALLISHR